MFAEDYSGIKRNDKNRNFSTPTGFSTQRTAFLPLNIKG